MSQSILAGAGPPIPTTRGLPPTVLRTTLRQYRRLLRYRILAEHRPDILATSVLGYQIAPLHSAILTLELIQRKALILAPRGFGKSTIGTICYCIYRILQNPNIRILIVSNTGGQAETFLREIRAQFEMNRTLRAIFGNFVGGRGRWGVNEIAVRPRTSTKKEMTVTALGITGQIITKHYDIIILDDIVDEDNVRTEVQRMRLKNTVFKTLMPCLLAWGQLVVIGTRWHYSDLYNEFIRLAGYQMAYYGHDGQFDIRHVRDDKKRSPVVTPERDDEDEYGRLIHGNPLLGEDEDDLTDEDLVV